MPSRKSVLIGLACAIFAVGCVVFRASKSFDTQPELEQLRGLGVPLSIDEVVAAESNRFPIEKVDKAVEAVQQNPSFPKFASSSRYRPGSLKVQDLELALKSQGELNSELEHLENLLMSVNGGFKWNRDNHGYWRPETEKHLSNSVRFILNRKLQVHIANRDLKEVLESAALLDHLAEQVYLTPGNIGSDLGNRTQSVSLIGYAAALQAGFNQEKWVKALEKQTREPLPKVDARLFTHEIVPGTLSSFAGQQSVEHLKGTQYLGLGWFLPSYRKQVEYKWAKLIRQHQSSVEDIDGDVERYREVYRNTRAVLDRDTTSVGSTVRSLWIDFEDALERVLKERARWAALRAAIAVLQHRKSSGALPKSLDGLDVPKDPFTGADLRYLPSSTGFIVYSPGVDGDQGGSRSTDFGVEIDLSAK